MIYHKPISILAIFFLSTLLSTAQAAPIDANAEFSLTGYGSTLYTGTNLNNASSITFGQMSGSTTAAGLGDFGITSAAGDFGSGGLAPLTTNPFLPSTYGTIVSPLQITGFSAITNFLTWGTGNRYTFDLTSLTRETTTSNFLALSGLGLFHDANGTFNTTQASIAITAQQSANSVSWSASWATPPAIAAAIPEPTNIVLLSLGLLLLGLQAVARRKAA